MARTVRQHLGGVWRSCAERVERLPLPCRLSSASAETSHDPPPCPHHHLPQPRCSTSRNTLALLREQGFEPEVIEYLRNPPDRPTLRALIEATGQPSLALVRTKSTVHRAGPGRAGRDRCAAHRCHAAAPILINRPIVVAAGARLCRPAEQGAGDPRRIEASTHTHQRMNQPARHWWWCGWAQPDAGLGLVHYFRPRCWRSPWRGTWRFHAHRVRGLFGGAHRVGPARPLAG